MKTLARYALCIGAAALLAGCGSRPVVEPGAAPQQYAVGANHPASSGDTLIYAFENVVGGHGIILQYPSGKLVDYVQTARFEPLSACSDDGGNVFVGGSTYSGSGYIAEYAFGATSPYASVTLDGGQVVRSCSVDGLAGDVAAIVRNDAGSYYVTVLPKFQGPGKSYTYSGMPAFVSIAYDGSGNLFLLGTSLTGKKYYLAELPSGGSSFEPISFNLGKHISRVSTLQWDGTYLTVAATYDDGAKRIRHWPQRIYRFVVSGSRATLFDTIGFSRLQNFGFGTSWIQPDRNLILFASNYYGVWKYPGGGKRLEKYDGACRRACVQLYIAAIAAPASRRPK